MPMIQVADKRLDCLSTSESSSFLTCRSTIAHLKDQVALEVEVPPHRTLHPARPQILSDISKVGKAVPDPMCPPQPDKPLCTLLLYVLLYVQLYIMHIQTLWASTSNSLCPHEIDKGTRPAWRMCSWCWHLSSADRLTLEQYGKYTCVKFAKVGLTVGSDDSRL